MTSPRARAKATNPMEKKEKARVVAKKEKVARERIPVKCVGPVANQATWPKTAGV